MSTTTGRHPVTNARITPGITCADCAWFTHNRKGSRCALSRGKTEPSPWSTGCGFHAERTRRVQRRPQTT